MAAPNHVHTAGNAVPNVDDTDLGDVLADLRGIHPGIDMICDAARLIAHDRLSLDQTQTLVAALGGSAGADVLTALALLIERLANADTNPALRTLPLDQQKTARQHGEQTAYGLNDPDLHQPAADTAATIDRT